MSSSRRRNNRPNQSHYQHQYNNTPIQDTSDDDYYVCNFKPQYLQSPNDSKNVAQSTLTLTQIASILVVIGSVIISGFSAWSNLNRELDLQKNNLETFKAQSNKDVDNIETSIKDLKKTIEDAKNQTQKSNEMLEQRIQSLDASVSQIYQKVTTGTTK